MLETKLSYGRGDGDEACCDGKGTVGDGGDETTRIAFPSFSGETRQR